MSIQSGSQTAGAGAAIALVATLISIYIVSQFLRNSIGVIAPDLAAANLALSPAELGLLSSVFFLRLRGDANAARRGARPLRPAALPDGGRRRSRWSAPSCSPLPQRPACLICGRALLGSGRRAPDGARSPLYARRFPPDRFATLAGLQFGFGTIGALLATAPLAFSTATHRLARQLPRGRRLHGRWSAC